MDEFVKVTKAASLLAEYLEAKRQADWTDRGYPISYRLACVYGDIAKTRKMDVIRAIRAQTDMGLKDCHNIATAAYNMRLRTTYEEAIDKLRGEGDVLSLVTKAAQEVMTNTLMNPNLSKAEISLINAGVRELAAKLGVWPL